MEIIILLIVVIVLAIALSSNGDTKKQNFVEKKPYEKEPVPEEISSEETHEPSAEESAAHLHFKITQDWAEFDVQNPTDLGEIRDVSLLPHPKQLILESIAKEIVREEDTQMAMAMGLSASNLSLYQEGIGSQPIRALGLSKAEIDNFSETLKGNTKSEESSHLLSKMTDDENNSRWNKYFSLVQSDLTAIQNRMLLAHMQRPKKLSFSESEERAVTKLVFSTAAIGSSGVKPKIPILTESLKKQGVSDNTFMEELREVASKGKRSIIYEMDDAIDLLNESSEEIRLFTLQLCCRIVKSSEEINEVEMGIIDLMKDTWKLNEAD